MLESVCLLIGLLKVESCVWSLVTIHIIYNYIPLCSLYFVIGLFLLTL